MGDKVWLHAFGCYYPGEVVNVADRRATVKYVSGTGATREKAVRMDDSKLIVPGHKKRPANTRGKRGRG